MGSLFEVLAVREAAVGARVEELTTLIVELTGQLESERERLSRLVVTRETLTELAAEGSGLVELPEAPVQRPVASPGPAGVSAPGPVVGVLTVPHRQPGVGLEVLPADYRDIVEVVTDAPGPIRAKQVVPRVGLVVSAGRIEGTRAKLKRLVARGWLAEDVPGLFTPAGDEANGEPGSG